MRFFASFHYALNDSKFDDQGHIVYKYLSSQCEAKNLIYIGYAEKFIPH